MKYNLNQELNSIQLIDIYLQRQKIIWTKAQVIEKLGRFLTFRELQLLHKNHQISDAELGFYMDMKSLSTFTENQLRKLQDFHKALK
jgi:hypothetical protein